MSLSVRLGLDTDDPDDDGTLRTLLRQDAPLTLARAAGSSYALRLGVALVWGVAIVLDALTTWVALQGPFEERNPLPAYLMAQFGVGPVLVLGSLFCVGLAVLGWSSGGARVLGSVRLALAVLAFVKLGVALNNLALLA